jgi:glucose/arabinose dehydrogenase
MLGIGILTAAFLTLPPGTPGAAQAQAQAQVMLQAAEEFSSAEYGPGSEVELVEPFATESVRNRSQVVGWPSGSKPQAPSGFRVDLYADDLEAPRWTYVLPNGDVLAALSVDGRIVLLRDNDKDGFPDLRTDFLTGQSRPFGMLLLNGYLYVGNTDAVVRFRYQTGQTELSGSGEKILDLPSGGHWTRNLVASADGSKIYVSVGSRSNVDENGEDAKDPRRAAILEINPDGSGMRVFAAGLRNPVGMAWEPVTGMLWTAVNERDALGDRLVPDYITSVSEGAFYGWPYSYYGQNVDPRKEGERPDLVAKAIPPDYALGAHTASLGLTFYTANQFPEKYHGGAFIGQHGSWNRANFVGYKVAFLPFRDGKPAGPLENFLTGFIVSATEVYGRPVGVTVLPDGSLLVADDGDGKLWRVSYSGA